MEDYYKNLASQGKSDVVRCGIAIFNIGMGDVSMFPELLQVYQVWILKSGKVQTIHINTVDFRQY